MNNRYNSAQNGSLISFIVVGVLLAIVVVGGLYGLTRYNAQKAAETTASDTNDANGTDPVATNEQKPINNDKPVATSQPASPEAQNPPKASESTSAAATNTAPQAAKDLPTTGPADTLLSIVAVVALAFATTHYARSRS